MCLFVSENGKSARYELAISFPIDDWRPKAECVKVLTVGLQHHCVCKSLRNDVLASFGGAVKDRRSFLDENKVRSSMDSRR